ncbi:MAG: carbohydrate ABC transporter permease [Actinomyces sp.]|jgi:raffinose/stachyose/melibiose transport system permease protein|nr:carbohydrate ABC transporter permease [Actinomyces sp.]MCI1787363.1 carbohydrate ABC transporter permease [Actinomyces sp.]MCI1830819.1 carbohydrate ABC transporter permease [Actinomyces sp.]
MKSGHVVRGTVLVLVCLVQLIPFYLAVTTAFKPLTDLSSPWLFPVGGATLENFSMAVEEGGVLHAIWNSVVVTVSATAIVCVLGALAAYPLARIRSTLNRGIEILVLSVMMIPPLSILVPLYSMLNRAGLLNTYAGLILPLACLELPRAVFLYTQFLRSIPVSLEEAARVDGANTFEVFFRIVLPLLKPVSVTVVILTGVYVWNEFALSSYIMSGDSMKTLAPAIAAFFGEQGSQVNAAVAGSLLGAIPMIVAYVFLQKYFIRGMLAGADKG